MNLVDRKARFATLALLFSILMVTLFACTPTGGTAGIASVSIEGGNQQLQVGDTTTLTAEVAAKGGADEAVTWASSDEDVAAISENGKLEALMAGNTKVTATSVFDVSNSATITVEVIAAETTVWTEQFGSSASDAARAVLVNPDGTIIVVGTTRGVMPGAISQGGNEEIFMQKMTAADERIWTVQFGDGLRTRFSGATLAGDGGIITAGTTNGVLEDGYPGPGYFFVRKFKRSGEHDWTSQFGSGKPSGLAGVAVGPYGNIVVAGHTTGVLGVGKIGTLDAFVRQLKPDGSVDWTEQFGVPEGAVYVESVAVDSAGRIAVSGPTEADLAGKTGDIPNYTQNVYIRTFSPTGGLGWTKQFGSGARESVGAVTFDLADNLIIAGHTNADFAGPNQGDSSNDVFLLKLDPNGTETWRLQFGSSEGTGTAAVTTDSADNIIVAGTTVGELDGQTHFGGVDAFISKFDAAGAEVWNRQFGSSELDDAWAVTITADDQLVVAGETGGVLGSENFGDRDAFVRVFLP